MWLDQITNQSTKAILEGKLFCGGYVFSTLAAAGTALIHLTGGTKNSLVDVMINASGKCTVTPYKGTTYSAAGTALALNNRNIGSANVTDALLKHTPTVNVLGTACAPILVPGNTGGGGGTGIRVGSGFNDEYGFLLPAGADLLLEITNTSGAAIDVNPLIVLSELP